MSRTRACPATSCLLLTYRSTCGAASMRGAIVGLQTPPALSGHFLTLLAEQTVISFNLISALLLGDVAITLIRFSLLTFWTPPWAYICKAGPARPAYLSLPPSIHLPVFLPYCPPIHQSWPGMHIMFNLSLDPPSWQELFLTHLYIMSDTGGISGGYQWSSAF